MLGHERSGVELVFEDHGEELGVVPHLRVSLDAYVALVDEFILRVTRSKFKPNQVVAITFGGAIPGRAISQALGIPLAYLGAESYAPAANDDQRKMRPGADVVFARDLIVTRPGFGTRVLLVDDLADHGQTFRSSLRWLRRHSSYSPGIRDVHTACLWRKTHSEFTPTYEVDRVVPVALPGARKRTMPWIDQPLESLYAVPVSTIEERVAHRARTPDPSP